MRHARDGAQGRGARIARRLSAWGTTVVAQLPPGRVTVAVRRRLAARRMHATVRALTAGTLVVTDQPAMAGLAVVAGRPVVAVDLRGDGLEHSAQWPAGGDVAVVRSLEQARDAVLARLGHAAFTAEALRHLPPPTSPARPRPALVSVVMPAHNAAADIATQLRALAAQDYRGRFEVVVADNLSTDGTPERALAEAAALGLDLRVVDAGEIAGVSHARNAGCAAARGELIAVCDADDLVAPGWLSGLVDAASSFDMVGGSIDSSVVNPAHVRSWRMLPPPDVLPARYGFLPYAHGCNQALWRDVWERSGGWDESIRDGCDDIEFAWRLQLAGHTLGVAPAAVVHYRLRDTLTGHARQSYAYHRNAGLLMRRFRAHGARPSSLGAVAVECLYALRPLPVAAFSGAARAVMAGRMAALWGRIRSSVEHRVWAL
ncbi:MAG TPA: glycosyltransferase [Solirubrobacteraceae bacterium]|jgi:GT2 family glycosyltransferase|nr:glycosyltransferase [Solirubrobacteraceae bacterium]